MVPLVDVAMELVKKVVQLTAKNLNTHVLSRFERGTYLLVSVPCLKDASLDRAMPVWDSDDESLKWGSCVVENRAGVM